MDYFPKTEMSHLLPATTSLTSINYTPDFYSAYADSFDLSLLSTDDRETALLSSSSSSSSEINKFQSLSSSSASIISATSSDALNYIPTTIFNNNNNNDQTVTLHNNNNNNSTLSSNQIIPIIKTEKLWNCDTTTIPLQNNKNSTIIENNNFNINSTTNYNNNNNNQQQQQQQQQNICQEDYSNANTAASLLFQQLQKHYQFYPSPLPSPPQYEFCNLNSVSSSNNYSIYSPASSTLSPSPCPSLDQQLNNFGSTNCLNNNNNNNNIITNFTKVKQEYLILPPSPPDSNGSPSPSLNEIKSEPGDNDIETNFIDINTLLEKTLQNFEENQKINQEIEEQKHHQENNINFVTPVPQDHQLLREYLQDTTFQKKHNLKPLALESLIGGLGVRGDIEPVISLALEHAKRDAQATCAQLQISPDPQQWTATQVHAWIRSTIEQFKLQEINELELKFSEDGLNLLCLSEEEFIRRVPESGATIHAQLEIWKLACCENFQMDFFPTGPSTSTTTNNNNNNNTKNNWPTNDFRMDFTDDEDDDMKHQTSITTLNPTTTTTSTTTTAARAITNNISNENGQLITSTTATTTTVNTNNTIETVTSTIGQQQQQQQINQTTTGTISPTLSTNNASTNNITQQTTTTTNTTTTTTKAPRTGGSHIHLWQFLKELLASPQVHGTAIRWLDRNKGVFKIEDSVRVAKLWGRRKNRPAMNYDKLSRSIRQYYKKGIMKKTERSQRLVYQFCHPYSL